MVERLPNNVLTIVVVDLHVIERLEELEEDKLRVGYVSFHAGGELRQVLELAPSVRKRDVTDGEAAHKL